MVTAAWVRNEIAAIAELDAHDPEAGHGRQDEMLLKVLRHIADGGQDARELAAEALRVADHNPERWCA